MKYNNFFLFIIGALIFISSCSKELTLNPANNIRVSQGDYINIIHVNWDAVSNADHYNIIRISPNGERIAAGTVTVPPFDDYGFGLPDNKLEAGKKYKYVISSGANGDYGDSEYSEESPEGWIYGFKPIDVLVKREDNGTVTIQWQDPNGKQYDVYGNTRSCWWDIKRRYTDDLQFSKIHTTDHSGGDAALQVQTYTDKTVSKNEKAIYQIVGYYDYQFKNMDNDYCGGLGSYSFDESAESKDSSHATVTYQTIQINDLQTSADGYGYVKIKNINNVMYAAAIPKPVLGNPVIYKLNGTSWQNIASSYPVGLQNNFDKISISGDGNNVWVAGVSDSSYVYAFNSSWSNNLANNNMGLANKPDGILVEYFNNTLYALCNHDGKLELYSYDNNNVWASQGVVENSSGIFDLGFKVFNNKLYSFYHVYTSEQNSTLKIKHYEINNWNTDFEKSYDYLMNVDVSVNTSGEIYFTSESQKPDRWKGNIYKVTSQSTTEEMINSGNDWLIFPTAIDFDNVGNPCVIYTYISNDASYTESRLAVFDNGEWKMIAGDYSKHISPVDLESNNGLYFIYGDGDNVTQTNYPKIIKTMKYNR